MRQRGGNRYGGREGGFTETQTDSRPAVRAALIPHSPAASRSPPAASPSSLATCLSENNTAASGKLRVSNNQSKGARRDTERSPVCHLFGFQHPSPPLSARVLREDRLRTGRTWRPGFVVVTSSGALSDRSRTAGSALPATGDLHGCTMATFVCRVQFLDDTDPFNSTNFPEPTRPPLYTFREDIPLINQLAGVHRLLKAPHKVGSPAVNSSQA